VCFTVRCEGYVLAMDAAEHESVVYQRSPYDCLNEALLAMSRAKTVGVGGRTFSADETTVRKNMKALIVSDCRWPFDGD
jgi:hypothetical protein